MKKLILAAVAALSLGAGVAQMAQAATYAGQHAGHGHNSNFYGSQFVGGGD